MVLDYELKWHEDKIAQLKANLATMTEWAAGLERGCVTVEGVEFSQRGSDVWSAEHNSCQLLVLYEKRREPRFFWNVSYSKLKGHKPTLREAMIAAVEAVKNA